MIHHRTEFRGKEVLLRDIEEGDVELLVSYWHQSSEAFLRSLGVDLAKLRSPEETRRLFRDSIPRGNAQRSRVSYVVESEKTVIAYTNLNIQSMNEAYAHFHVLTGNLWAKAVCYLLFPKGMQLFFSAVPVTRIVFQISPENQNIKRMLERFQLQGHQRYIEAPDGMARSGLFNIYEIDKTQTTFSSLFRSPDHPITGSPDSHNY